MIAYPLYKLTKKGAKFIWNEECEVAYKGLKKAISTAPVLKRPDFEKEFKLFTDASRIGVGAILVQEDEQGQDHPVYYASRKLVDAETRYPATHLECLAVVWAIQKFHHYLAGSHFKVYTDHNALKWLLRLSPLKESNYRLCQWITLLQGYDYEVIYRRGKDNEHVDALSRLGY